MFTFYFPLFSDSFHLGKYSENVSAPGFRPWLTKFARHFFAGSNCLGDLEKCGKRERRKKAPDSCPDNFRRCRFQISIFWMNWMIEEVALRRPFHSLNFEPDSKRYLGMSEQLIYLECWSEVIIIALGRDFECGTQGLRFTFHVKKQRKNVSDLKRATSQRARTAHFSRTNTALYRLMGSPSSRNRVNSAIVCAH